MDLSDLLLKTEAALDLNGDRRISPIETVYNIMRAYVPYHYIGNHVVAFARALAEYRPPELLPPVIDQFPTIR